MSNLLTDRDFWVKYWESKTDLSVVIPETYLFHRQLADIVKNNNVKTAIELGGFPGYYAVFLKKYLKLDVTLLDYFVHPPITEQLLETNNLAKDDIHIIETDLFNYTPAQQYDLVLSCGLIEHFNDTADIINRHIAFVKPGGSLFITLPNFKALNGWFQKNFDKENYDKHNIDCMDPALLEKICAAAGLEVIQSRYFGRFSLWLENEQQKSLPVRLLKKTMWLMGKLFTKVFAFDSKQLSPYILLEAKKK
ncbi:bifunctional 2-polyprenyl-6-hydroxyphenol methylase/3-demethylubiquinol 3-O-methyltransferase UbiG [Pedobacter sp. Hv1]|uniref:class I SAM-dependent methyltransferase n=1 Tax=Pedobacter sp. Hv1 TaxID=1740090 RepID=UPI0006D8D410|nr:methyltransferase domain-containing protein [Pedobacter sp. Hv1]KQB99581.1 methyltransferase type 12 [Pedobacter sp. Hv1]